MGAAIALRTDYDGAALRRLAKVSDDANQTRRLLALAVIYDGGKRVDAAALGGVRLQIIRDWVLRFNAEGPEGLIDRKAPGAKRRLNEEQMKELGAIVETGPDPAVHGVVRWRRCDLQKLIEERFGVVYKERAISNLLADLGFSRISGRPQHPAQDRRVIDAFKKTSRARLRPT